MPYVWKNSRLKSSGVRMRRSCLVYFPPAASSFTRSWQELQKVGLYCGDSKWGKNFLVRPGCPKDATPQCIDAQPLNATTICSGAGHVSTLRSQCLVSLELRFHSRTDAVSFHPSSLLLSSHSVLLRHGAKVTEVKVFPWVIRIHCTTICIHNIHSNRRKKSFRRWLLYWFSVQVIANLLEKLRLWK